jgi:integrase
MLGGLRIGEALALDWTDADYHAGQISIAKQWVEQHACVEEGTKNDTARNVTLPSWFVAELKESRGFGPIFTNQDGGPRATCQWQRMPRPHAIRHRMPREAPRVASEAVYPRISICTGNSFSTLPSFALRLYATTS